MDRNTLEMALQKAIQGEVRFDAVSRMLYRTDASIYEMEPLGLVVPKDEADVVAAVEIAAEQGAAILPRGGGTSLAGQSVGAAVHLDFSKYMNQILEFNPDERWVRVQPGLVLDELNAYLQPYGLIFAPDVSTSSRANIGGMIGNNSCGAHSMIYGKTIDHVLELKVVLADGSQAVFGPLDDEECQRRAGLDSLEGRIYREVRRIVREREVQIRTGFPEVMRRVSGYNLDEFISGAPFDLSKLVVGSEGTLCAVVEARLNLVELPAHKGLVAVHFHDLVEATEANLIALETSPVASELMDKILLDQTKDSPEHAPSRRLLQDDPAALLVVEYYADSTVELERKLDGLEQQLRGRGMGYAWVRAVDPADQQAIWGIRKAGLGLLMGMKGDPKPQPGVEDTSIPVAKLPDYVRRVEALMAELGIEAEYYGHASVGLLHIRPIFSLKDPEGIKLLRQMEERMSDMVLEYGGAMSGEHGDGLARSEWIAKMFSPELVAAFVEVKDAFDPQGIMNPGKITRPPRMDENLRYHEEYQTPEVETFFSFSEAGGFQEAVEMCSGVGHCRKKLVGTMCPSYMATLDEEHTTRGRANALRAALAGTLPDGLHSHEVHRVMDLCLECKACKAECPSSVDMAKLKYEFLAHYHRQHGYPLRSRLFADIARISRLGSALAPLSNWIGRSRLNRWLLDAFLGIDRRRRLPAFARQPFSRWFVGRRPSRGTKGRVVLFNDTFVEYNEPAIGMAATIILERAGYEVVLVANKVCCGRPFISKGFLDRARVLAQRNVEVLAPWAEEGVPIIGLEPSCASALSDDYLDLVDDPRSRLVAEQVVLLEDFLVRESPLDLEFTSTIRHILVHGHCHQKALTGTAATVSVLNMPPHFRAEEIPSGCCGMAGSFGYEKEHFEISRAVGQERLFAVLEDAAEDVEIAAVGTSCRHQIADFTGRRARHWAEIFVEAL
ncbi:MAG: FAD-binding protein [Candidatus Latescibacteria bacterium]|nr:FAD-binding protein [Candidatus Latescibacterota bacterium]